MKISDNGKYAERLDCRQEFNNGLLFSKKTLRDGECFEVVFEEKVDSWSGSIEIGVTTLDPSSLEIPASATALCEGSWILSGSIILQNGETVREDYKCDLDVCEIGDKIGVQRTRKGDLKFYLNGQDQGIAATGIPRNVYAVVDLYGKCTRVSISETRNHRGLAETFHSVTPHDLLEMTDASDSDSMSDSDDSGLPENRIQGEALVPLHGNGLKFHPRHGTAIELLQDGKVAMRRNALSEFDNGVVLTHRPLEVDELFEVKIEKLCHKWSGSLEIGVTSHSPEAITFPTTMTNMQTGTVLMSGSGILTNGKGTMREYGELSLFELRENDRIGLTRRNNGDLHFFINGRDQGLAASGTGDTLYGVVDLYGMAEKVSIVEMNRTSILKALDRRLMHLNYLRSLAKQELPQLFGGDEALFEEPLVFHPICGTNAEVTQNCLLAKMISPTESSDCSIVLSNRHLRTEEFFEFSIESMSSRRAHNFKFGVTVKTPGEIDDLTSTGSLGPDVWYLKGTSVFQHERIASFNYAQSLANIKKGDRLGIIRRANGNLHFFYNGSNLGVAATNVAARVHAFVQFDGVITGVLALKQDEKSIVNIPEEAETEPASSDCKPRFHQEHGKNVTIVNNGRTAFRPNPSEEFNFAIVLSSNPLKNGEPFEVLVEDMIYRWSGSLVLGVTSQKPEDIELPSTLTDLTAHTWILNGTSIIRDGFVFNSSFPIDLDQLQVGTRIGLVRHEDGTVDVVLDGEEKYQAFVDVPGEVYGIFDLYGQCCQVTVTQSEGDISPDSPLFWEPSDSNVSNSSAVASTKPNISSVPGIPHKFHSCCGSNVSVSEDNLTATRTDGFDNGVVFSSKPIRPGELFEVKISRVSKIWSGSLSIGFTKYNPGAISPRHLTGPYLMQPHTLEDLVIEGLWVMQGSDIKKNGRVVKSNYAPTLERLSVGFSVGVFLTTECAMHVFLNGHDMGLAVADLPKSVYAVLDLYGQVESVTVTSSAVNLPEEPLRAPSLSSNSSEDIDKEADAETADKHSLFRFHSTHGKNVLLSNENLTAKRTSSYDHGTVFSHKPLGRQQLFEVRIDVLNCHWTSSIKIGVVGLSPNNISLPANACCMRRSTWIVQEDAVFHNSKKIRGKLKFNLDNIKEGRSIGVLVDADNNLHLFLDKQDMGVVVQDVPSHCYAVVDLYGQCQQISVVSEDITGAIGPPEEKEKAALESGLKEHSPISVLLPSLGLQGRKCDYQELCARFKETLGLPDGFFEVSAKLSKCYCYTCHKHRGEEAYSTKGDPPRGYSRPLGWCKFAVRLNTRADVIHVLETWNVAYHGTSPGLVRKILDRRTLIPGGELLYGGLAYSYPQPEDKEHSSETKQVLMSPTIKYAGSDLFCEKHKFTDYKTKKTYSVRVAFQVLVRPGCYTVSGENIGANQPVDPYFENSEIEWHTKEKQSVVLSALLINVD